MNDKPISRKPLSAPEAGSPLATHPRTQAFFRNLVEEGERRVAEDGPSRERETSSADVEAKCDAMRPYVEALYQAEEAGDREAFRVAIRAFLDALFAVVTQNEQEAANAEGGKP